MQLIRKAFEAWRIRRELRAIDREMRRRLFISSATHSYFEPMSLEQDPHYWRDVRRAQERR